MVLLTMTPSIVDGLAKLGSGAKTADEPVSADPPLAEPAVGKPAVGKPISHGQIVDLWQRLQSSQHPSYSLETLLGGSRVYIPPLPPKPEPSDEYKALMARLRREEAARAYQRMVNPPPHVETFSDRFPTAAQAFAEANRPSNAADLGDDDVTYGEVHRQVMLVVNFLVSIVGVAGTLWVAARWWSLPARLLLALGGSIVVAVAEVGVYQGYVWRMGRAKERQKAVREVKEVVKTWVLGPDEGADDGVLLESKEDAGGTVRKRATAESQTAET